MPAIPILALFYQYSIYLFKQSSLLRLLEWQLIVHAIAIAIVTSSFKTLFTLFSRMCAQAALIKLVLGYLRSEHGY
ncbi:hypothetical protein N482_24430 [Pseudoalteromonas luteoviolacea NCIMB 1942]|uniref:Uncharacterized protein n=1 Tax=Pseudoalteromonas luteoviolacea NCIMB 1942 TaxID=1365253 RepID=A0A167G9U7_9GAMM|nr:hypothetical protein N482_24430 [Pseudoalteromonas luteoviolacea NCIMB 1942]